jgi:hypothetical protein
MKEPSLQFVGIFVPRDLVLRDDLSLTEKVLTSIIDSLDNGEGCWASNGYLSGIVGCGERQVREYLTRLETLGVIIRKQDASGQRRITTVYAKAIRDLKKSSTAENLRPPQAENLQPPRQETATNRKENKKEDNTINIEGALIAQGLDVNEKTIKAVTDFANHRADIKRPLTQRSLEMNVGVIAAQAKASGTDHATAAVDIVSATIRNGWYGLFPLRKPTTPTKKTLTANDHGDF